MPKPSLSGPSRHGAVLNLAPHSTGVAILLLAGLLAGLIALSISNLNAIQLIISIVSGVIFVAAFAIGLRFFVQSESNKIKAAFFTYSGNDPDPAFLTDLNGQVESVNQVASSFSPDPKDAQTVLGAMTNDAAGLAYRCLRALSNDQRFEESFVGTDGTSWRLEVQLCRSSKVIWNIRAVKRENPSTKRIAEPKALPFLVSDASGKIIYTNEDGSAFTKLLEPVLEEQTQDLDSGGFASSRFDTPESGVVRQYSFRNSEGATETIVVREDNEDLTQAHPDQVLDALPVALARVCEDGNLAYANEAARQLLGPKAIAGTKLESLMEGLGRSIDDRISDMLNGRSHMRSEVARAKVQGQEIFLQVTLKRLTLSGEACLLAVINDATELKTLEAQFVQSQKMQAVGQLAGGVAHDFNNLLTAINGHCDLILMRHEPTNTDYGDLIQIRHNANRAASLVGQLLAFSRKQTLLPKVIDLYDTLSDLNHLLNRLLGEKVTLKIEHDDNLSKVRVDKRQLEQVIMNLVVNARDAMPNGGEVAIHTKTVTFEKDFERDRAVVPFGQYVQIDVSDTGTGIPQDKIAKIFEPFFTTKRVGEGTGLGLSTAYGIIKQTGGFIFASSEVGAGTTFTIYLPALVSEDDASVSIDAEPVQPTDLTGRGVVLLVEDEIPVRSFAARALTIRGYSVIEAASAEEALEILEDDTLHVDIFVSDVIMPGMDGPTWVRMAQEKRPDTKVVFVSGYAEDAFEGGKMSIPNATFLPKPFSLNELTHTVKEQIGDLLH